MIAALDLIAHGGLVKALLRSSSIDQGSQGVRSSGGRPPFFAHASELLAIALEGRLKRVQSAARGDGLDFPFPGAV